MKPVNVVISRLGKIRYQPALDIQVALRNKLLEDPHSAKQHLLLCEHHPVYTVGKRHGEYTEWDQQRLTDLGAEYYVTDRGGLITYHGPGQLVVYPILNLRNFKPSIRWFVSTLEQTVIAVCRRFGLSGERSPHTGVWIGNDKVCAMGINNKNYITSHGLALNCDTELRWFANIVPCGINDKGVTSLSNELGRSVTIDEVLPHFLDEFRAKFNCNYMEDNRAITKNW